MLAKCECSKTAKTDSAGKVYNTVPDDEMYEILPEDQVSDTTPDNKEFTPNKTENRTGTIAGNETKVKAEIKTETETKNSSKTEITSGTVTETDTGSQTKTSAKNRTSSGKELDGGMYPLFLLPKRVSDIIKEHGNDFRTMNIKRTGRHNYRISFTIADK